jgi:hypothetical protein
VIRGVARSAAALAVVVALGPEPAGAAIDLARHLILGGATLDLRGSAVSDEALAALTEPAFAGVRSALLAGTAVSDAGLEHLRALAGLEELDLHRTGVAGPGLGSLAGLPLRRLSLGATAVGDADLARLAGLPLETLVLGGTQVGDAGIAQLRGLPLRRLDLSGTRVTDAGLGALAGLARLEFLDLSGTAVSDRGLLALSVLPGLREVYAAGSRVTAAGAAAAEGRRAGLRVDLTSPSR